MTRVGSERGRPLRTRLVGLGIATLLRGIRASWRVDAEGLEELDRRLARREAMIAVFWHGQYPALLPLMRGRRVCVFTSLSPRGDAIAEVLGRLGFDAVQIADSGGERSLATMRRALAGGRPAAIAVDGPLGPRHVVHRGAVRLASDLGHAIVPLAVAAAPLRALGSRWDELALPLPFARVRLVVDTPLPVPRGLADDALGPWIERTRCALEQVDARARAALEGALRAG